MKSGRLFRPGSDTPAPAPIHSTLSCLSFLQSPKSHKQTEKKKTASIKLLLLLVKLNSASQSTLEEQQQPFFDCCCSSKSATDKSRFYFWRGIYVMLICADCRMFVFE